MRKAVPLKKFFLFFALFLIFCGAAIAAPAFDMRDFSRTPVLHEGRVKPLDSVARAELRFISGYEKTGDLSAIEWLAEMFFDPDAAVSRPIFEINDPFVREQLGFSDEARNIFSFEDLQPGLKANKKIFESLIARGLEDFEPGEQALLNLYEKAEIFAKSSDPESLFQNYRGHKSLWNALAKAYQDEDSDSWRKYTEILRHESAGDASPMRLSAELLYNQFKPWFLSEIMYAAFLIFSLTCFFRGYSPSSLIFYTVYAAALGLQGLGIAARIFILDRPPVGSLYESILFVSFIVPLVAFVGWRRFRDRALLSAGAGIALFLLLIAPVFAPAGDSLEVLVAVLNTNFWLATHVIFITAGYALCVFTACLAHVALFRRGFSSANIQERMRFESRINFFLMASLFFTCFGTVLGGIWADQSWGRFWGWDPKENGALFIALWIVWILHGKRSGRIGPFFYLAAIGCLNLCVASSWVGVNLLGTGLHSYGFTSQAALGLALFCAVEAALITGLTLRAKNKESFKLL